MSDTAQQPTGASQSVITEISGRVVPVLGDQIDTDRIIPARFLKCVTFDALGPQAFCFVMNSS